MSEKKNRKKGVILLISGILLSIVFIALGYWLTAVIGVVIGHSVDFLAGFCIVMGKPFDKYFNELTPVGMSLGFIIAEVLFFFLIVKNRSKDDILNEDEYAPDIIDIADKAGMDYPDSKKASKLSDKELFIQNSPTMSLSDEGIADYVQPEDTLNTEDNNIQENVNEKQEEVSFDDAIVTDLLNDYDLSQIAAMLQIKKYIEIEDVTLLKKMFKPYMTASDITSYIEMFYE